MSSAVRPGRFRAVVRELLRVAEPTRLLALKRKAEFLLGARCGRSLYVTSRAELLLHGKTPDVRIGSNVIIDGTLECYDRGKLVIGDHVFVGRARVYATHDVRIGSYALISDGVCVMDSDLHPTDFRLRRLIAESGAIDVYTETTAEAVCIDEDVWIGYGTAILKGVHVGQGAIIGAGSVVTANVAPWTVVAGSPARAIGMVPGKS